MIIQKNKILLKFIMGNYKNLHLSRTVSDHTKAAFIKIYEEELEVAKMDVSFWDAEVDLWLFVVFGGDEGGSSTFTVERFLRKGTEVTDPVATSTSFLTLALLCTALFFSRREGSFSGFKDGCRTDLILSIVFKVSPKVSLVDSFTILAGRSLLTRDAFLFMFYGVE